MLASTAAAEFCFFSPESCLASVACGGWVGCAGTRLFVGWECSHSGFSRHQVSDRTEQRLTVSVIDVALIRRRHKRPVELQVSASERLARERDACVLKNGDLFCCQLGWLIFSPQFVSSGSFLEDEQFALS